MNRRQKKKFKKKFGCKKYKIIKIIDSIYNEDTDITDFIILDIHNGSRKIIKCILFRNVYPIANQCNTSDNMNCCTLSFDSHKTLYPNISSVKDYPALMRYFLEPSTKEESNCEGVCDEQTSEKEVCEKTLL